MSLQETGTATYQLEGQTAVLRPRGALDLHGAAEFHPVLQEAVEAAMRCYCFDLREVTFIDSAGMEELARALAVLRARGAEVLLQNQSPRVRRAFNVTGFGRLLHELGMCG